MSSLLPYIYSGPAASVTRETKNHQPIRSVILLKLLSVVKAVRTTGQGIGVQVMTFVIRVLVRREKRKNNAVDDFQCPKKIKWKGDFAIKKIMQTT